MSPPLRLKQCIRKNRYATDLEARNVIKRARQRQYDRAALLREYYCDFCAGFHLTHKRLRAPRPPGESLIPRLKRMLKDLCRAKREASEKGWPTIEHEARIAYMRSELQGLLDASVTRDNATAA